MSGQWTARLAASADNACTGVLEREAEINVLLRSGLHNPFTDVSLQMEVRMMRECRSVEVASSPNSATIVSRLSSAGESLLTMLALKVEQRNLLVVRCGLHPVAEVCVVWRLDGGRGVNVQW
jgi:hypothetical protein